MMVCRGDLRATVQLLRPLARSRFNQRRLSLETLEPANEQKIGAESGI